MRYVRDVEVGSSNLLTPPSPAEAPPRSDGELRDQPSFCAKLFFVRALNTNVKAFITLHRDLSPEIVHEMGQLNEMQAFIRQQVNRSIRKVPHRIRKVHFFIIGIQVTIPSWLHTPSVHGTDCFEKN